MERIKQKIREFLSEQMFADEIQDDDSLLGTGVVDSTGVFELAGFVEEEFNITIEPKEAIPANMDSLNKLGGFIQDKLEVA